MPRVPLLTGPSVRLRPLNVPEVTPTSEGMDVAAGLQTAGRVLGELAEVADRADKAVVENAEVGFARTVDQIFVNEAQTGFLQLKGTAVRDAYQKLGEQFDKAEQEAIKDLNPRQRQIFQQTAQRSRVVAMRRADDYLDRELKAVEDANSKALQQNALSRISLDAADPVLVQEHVTKIVEQAELDARRAGLDTPARDALVSQARSTARYTQIAALVDADNIDGAMKAYELYKKDITDPQQREQAGRLIEQETLRVRSQRTSDDIIAKAGKDERKALEEARKLSGTLRDEVEQRIRAYYNQEAQLVKQDQEATLDAASAQLERTGNLNFLRGEQLQKIREIPGAMAALQERARQIQRFGATGGAGGAGGAGGGAAPGNTDWDLYSRLVQDAATNPEALISINPAQVRPYLGNTEFKWFVDARAKAISGNDDGARISGQSEATVQQLTLDIGRAVGMFPADKEPSKFEAGDLRRYNAVQADIRQRIEEAEAKGPISPAEKRKIAQQSIAARAQLMGGTKAEEVRVGIQKMTRPQGVAPSVMPADQTATIRDWSGLIVQFGGTPTLAKVQRMQQVIYRMQPPAYTDADREMALRRIALEP